MVVSRIETDIWLPNRLGCSDLYTCKCFRWSTFHTLKFFCRDSSSFYIVMVFNSSWLTGIVNRIETDMWLPAILKRAWLLKSSYLKMLLMINFSCFEILLSWLFFVLYSHSFRLFLIRIVSRIETDIWLQSIVKWTWLLESSCL